MKKRKYETDLADERWGLIKSFIPDSKHGGRPGSINMRRTMNAIFMSCEQDANGACCRCIFRHGKQCTDIFACGRKKAYFEHYINFCMDKFANRKAAYLLRV